MNETGPLDRKSARLERSFYQANRRDYVSSNQGKGKLRVALELQNPLNPFVIATFLQWLPWILQAPAHLRRSSALS